MPREINQRDLDCFEKELRTLDAWGNLKETVAKRFECKAHGA